MTFSVCFIERRDGPSPSIERVFRAIASELEKLNIATRFVSVPFGNSAFGTFLNLILFRPPSADLYHVTGHVNYLGLVLPPERTVLTIHDLTILGVKSGLRRWLIEKLYFVWPSRRLRYLTAISDCTRDSLVASAGIPPEKVRVVANPLIVAVGAKRRFNEKSPVILQVGTHVYKNVDRVVEAIAGLDCQLHIVGKISETLHERIRELSISLVNDESLGDEAIEVAYRNADIVTLCSTVEGFGLPIIEGQAAGCVVVTSDRSPMKEVAGAGAILVNPEDTHSIREGIVSVLHCSELTAEVIEKGKQNIRRFDRSKIADDYLSIYRKILEGVNGRRSE